MGFSAALQGKAAHEALLCRQDAELRLLDLMRRCLLSKVRCDREYALALGALAQQGLKVERGEDLAGSLVAKAWRGMLEELDNTGKAVRHNADCLEKDTLEKLTGLYADKRKARKQYQEEHARIAHQFTQVSTPRRCGPRRGAGPPAARIRRPAASADVAPPRTPGPTPPASHRWQSAADVSLSSRTRGLGAAGRAAATLQSMSAWCRRPAPARPHPRWHIPLATIVSRPAAWPGREIRGAASSLLLPLSLAQTARDLARVTHTCCGRGESCTGRSAAWGGGGGDYSGRD
ncbi:hypothetical protein ONE63_007649 [Megalurothrips usitatus]|uniref:FCH domain-containing protein n=1 Tax=Megalurothrips usitatus TaxID=439358 RepID=A0AAV7XPF2_9NEOP|nr:hypothetical protein ONE63_007649 [Megalurothrips usitatus]